MKHFFQINKNLEEFFTILKNMVFLTYTGIWFLEDYGEVEKVLKLTYDFIYFIIMH